MKTKVRIPFTAILIALFISAAHLVQAQMPAQPTKDMMAENPTAEADMKLVKDFVNTLVADDLVAAKTFMADNFMNYGPGVSDSSALEATLTDWKTFNKSNLNPKFPFIMQTFSVLSGRLKGNWVSLWGNYSATIKEKAVSQPVYSVFRVVGGKIISERDYFDNLSIMKQRGFSVIPPKHSVSATPQTTEAEISDLFGKYQMAFTNEDDVALKNLLTKDCVRVEGSGKTYNGADAIQARFIEVFNGGPSSIIIKVANVVMQNSENATATGIYHISGKTIKGEDIDRRGAFNNTIVKEAGHWKISKLVLTPLVKTMVYHKVADFAKWKTVFDSMQAMRLASGELSYDVSTLSDDPTMVYVISEWASNEAAQAFFASPKLADAMNNAGVIEKPNMMILAKK